MSCECWLGCGFLSVEDCTCCGNVGLISVGMWLEWMLVKCRSFECDHCCVNFGLDIKIVEFFYVV